MVEFPEDPFEIYKRGSKGPALDLGTGSGDNIRRILSSRKDGFVVGIDVDPDVMEPAMDTGAELVQAASEHLPFRNESFVMVASTYSFHHFEDREAAAEEVRRVLKPSGFAFIIDWLPESRALAYHTKEHLKRCMFETLSAFQDRFDRFNVTVREEEYLVFVEKEE